MIGEYMYNFLIRNHEKIINLLTEIQVYCLIITGTVFILILIIFPLIIIGYLPIFMITYLAFMWIIVVICLSLIPISGFIKRYIRKILNNEDNF